MQLKCGFPAFIANLYHLSLLFCLLFTPNDLVTKFHARILFVWHLASQAFYLFIYLLFFQIYLSLTTFLALLANTSELK